MSETFRKLVLLRQAFAGMGSCCILLLHNQVLDESKSILFTREVFVSYVVAKDAVMKDTSNRQDEEECGTSMLGILVVLNIVTHKHE